ncbi:helix-turn-helix transcriptional regulator [Streptomyces sp. NPDC051079]|uniref:helix-turn-helix transcriptional regulator n=1 Tax=Streptomyces sp. NPDC051079 TaxID=3155043 RepID=UPI00344D6AEB
MTILPPEPNFEALRLRLAGLRGDRGWSYDDLAERTGKSRRTLIEIEQGRTIGSLDTWHALGHAFNVPLAELFAALCEDHGLPGATR